ncbi:MAG: sugar phosphate nucleotidyltransferase [Candidatus Hodarchaeota archaeon]
MKALLLAAGHAKRLRPLSYDYPKALVPFLNTPLISILVQRLLTNREIGDIGVVVGNLKEKVIKYFKEKTKHSIEFFVQNKQLGTAHAALTAGSWLDDDVLILAADCLFSRETIDQLIENHLNSNASASIALEPVPFDQIHKGSSVEIINRQITKIIEKPAPWEAPSSLNAAAIYLFRHEALNYLSRISPSSRGEYEVPSALNLLIKEGKKVNGTVITRIGHLTTPQDYYDLNYKLLAEHSTDSSFSFINDFTEIPAGVEVKRCIIGSNCSILPSVKSLRNCLVLEGSTIRQKCNDSLIWYSSAENKTKTLKMTKSSNES